MGCCYGFKILKTVSQKVLEMPCIWSYRPLLKGCDHPTRIKPWPKWTPTYGMLVPEHLARDPKINAELQLVPECISQNMPNNSLNIVPESLEKPKISEYPSISPTSSQKSPKNNNTNGISWKFSAKSLNPPAMFTSSTGCRLLHVGHLGATPQRQKAHQTFGGPLRHGTRSGTWCGRTHGDFMVISWWFHGGLMGISWGFTLQ